MFSATFKVPARCFAALTTRSAPARVSLIWPRITSSGLSALGDEMVAASTMMEPRYLSMFDSILRQRTLRSCGMLNAVVSTLQMLVKKTCDLSESFLCLGSGRDHCVLVVRQALEHLQFR